MPFPNDQEITVPIPVNELRIILDLARKALLVDQNILRTMRDRLVSGDEQVITEQFVREHQQEIDQQFDIVNRLKKLCNKWL